MDDAQAADVDPQFHRWRAKQSADLSGPKLIFTLNSHVGAQLPRVILSAQTLGFGEIARVEALKKQIGLWCLVFIGALLDQISLDRLAIAQLPDDLL